MAAMLSARPTHLPSLLALALQSCHDNKARTAKDKARATYHNTKVPELSYHDHELYSKLSTSLP